ncbi:MAG: hypothetical protein ACE5OT_03485 [Candidatus Hadarchaeaceae archaeon]
MSRLDQRGVAALTAVVVIAASTGAAVATPVIVDVADVDPDHPLYGLERLGERIRMVRDDDQMKERWGEYVRLIDRGKGVKFKKILEEFVEKMHAVAPGDTEAEREELQWMQGQIPGISRAQLRLSKELCEGLKDDLPELSEKINRICDEIENSEEWLEVAELRENVRARLRLIREKIENIVRRHKARIRRPVNIYFDIDNVLVDVDVTVNVEVNITLVRPIPIIAQSFEEKLSEFDNLLAEVQAMLEGAPENTHGVRAARRLVEVATKHKDRAVTAYQEGKLRRALGLIHAAIMKLRNAKLILEHASEWDSEFMGQWMQWRERWHEFKQELIEEGAWENILENWEQFAENMRHRWRERFWGT